MKKAVIPLLLLFYISMPGIAQVGIGTNNPHNVVKATFEGLKGLRTHEQIARKLGKVTAESEPISGKENAPSA